ncbi:hypothetical protein ACHQM5_017995 [Ranunculus cassubicifolius]
MVLKGMTAHYTGQAASKDGAKGTRKRSRSSHPVVSRLQPKYSAVEREVDERLAEALDAEETQARIDAGIVTVEDSPVSKRGKTIWTKGSSSSVVPRKSRRAPSMVSYKSIENEATKKNKVFSEATKDDKQSVFNFHVQDGEYHSVSRHATATDDPVVAGLYANFALWPDLQECEHLLDAGGIKLLLQKKWTDIASMNTTFVALMNHTDACNEKMARLESDLQQCDPVRVVELEAAVKKQKVELASCETELARLRKSSTDMDQRLKEYNVHMLVHTQMEAELKKVQAEHAELKKFQGGYVEEVKKNAELTEKLQSETCALGVLKTLCHTFQASVNRYDSCLQPHESKCPELCEQIKATFLRPDSEFVEDIDPWFEKFMAAQNESDVEGEVSDEEAVNDVLDGVTTSSVGVMNVGAQQAGGGSVFDPSVVSEATAKGADVVTNP